MGFRFISLKKEREGKTQSMEKRSLAIALALTLPLVFYGIPYAYASTMTSTYVVDGPTVVLGGGDQSAAYATCNTGDYVTGGGYSGGVTANIVISNSEPVGSTNPTEWGIYVFNTGSSTIFVHVVATCQTPVTVAGISVPQFGSLYIAIALGAAVYFVLSRRSVRSSRTTVAA